MAVKKPDYTNEPLTTVPQDIDKEMATPTPHELAVAVLAEKNKELASKSEYWDITSKNGTAPRVIYNIDGASVVVQPGQTRSRIKLHPNIAAYLMGAKSDLQLTPSAPLPAPAA